MRYWNSVIAICCLLMLPGGAGGQSQAPPPIHALPLYEQCKALAETNATTPNAIAELKAKDTQTRIKAAGTLAKSCDSRATAALLAATKDDEISVKVAAVEALGKLGDQEAIDPLIELIEGADWQVRMALIRTLASFQVYRSNNAVLNALTNPGDKKITEESDLRVRCFGILTVNQMRDVRFSRKAIGFLFTFQEHQQPEFRRIAEETGLELRTTRNGFHEMAAILKQHNFPEFRRKAAYWLGKFSTDEARAVLEDAVASDQDPGVKQAAKNALTNSKKP